MRLFSGLIFGFLTWFTVSPLLAQEEPPSPWEDIDEDEPDEDLPDEDLPDEDLPDEDLPDEDQPDEDESALSDEAGIEESGEADSANDDESGEGDSTGDEAASGDAATSGHPTKGRPRSEASTRPTNEPSPDVPALGKFGQANIEKSEQAAAAALMDRPDPKPSLTPLTFSTSTFSRFEVRENYDSLGVSRGRFLEGDRTVFRARLGVQTNPLPLSDTADVLLQFSPQASGHWGQGGTVGEANLGIYEGYFQLRTPRLEVQVGRMRMSYGEALTIGDLDWHEAGRAFDGTRLRYKMRQGYLDVFATQVAEGGATNGTRFFAGDQWFWGLYSGVGEYLSPNVELDLYFLGLSSARRENAELSDGSTLSAEGAHLLTAGTRFLGRVSALDFRLEAGLQFGSAAPVLPTTGNDEVLESRTQLSYQVDAEVGVTMGKYTRLALGGVLASGDDPSTEKNEGYNELFPTGHQFLGLMDVIGPRSNVASGNFKLTRALFGGLSAALDAHLFVRLQDGGLASVEGKGLAGTELDAQLVQKLGKYVVLRGLYGLFIPASGHYQSDDLLHYAELQMGLTF